MLKLEPNTVRNQIKIERLLWIVKMIRSKQLSELNSSSRNYILCQTWEKFMCNYTKSRINLVKNADSNIINYENFNTKNKMNNECFVKQKMLILGNVIKRNFQAKKGNYLNKETKEEIINEGALMIGLLEKEKYDENLSYVNQKVLKKKNNL